ncbi:MAG: SDR family oxidoreductase [Deltaproteobacteria bacterium]|nr:SDR family oxidoreductase [Deltaproteobacteria bacterium]
MKKVLIVGATSAIAQEVAKLFAKDGDRIFLVARDMSKLEAVLNDLKVRGASYLDSITVDLDLLEQHDSIVQKAIQSLEGLDIVLVAHGVLGDQKAGEQDYQKAEAVLRTNFLSVVSLVTPLANYLEQQKSGCIAVISSVAGDRARQSNYLYGTAKGATSLFLQGLRNRLHPVGVTVTTIKPGFVDTPMTDHMKKSPLFERPEKVGLGIYKAILKKKDIVYLPWFWRVIMTIVRILPEPVFKRTRM